MSIWDKLPNKTWEELEKTYGTFDAMEGKPWIIIEKGYQYSYPSVESVELGVALVGLTYKIGVKVTEVLDPELAGAETLPTGEPFSGTVSVTFQNVDYDLVYNESSGLFEGVIPCPLLSDWSEDANTFDGLIVAENGRGAIAEPYHVNVYKPVPVVTSVSLDDCRVNESTTIRATVRLDSVPASEEISATAFFGTVTAAFFGNTYSLSAVDDNVFQASIIAPGASSWCNPGHVYVGTVTASLGGVDGFGEGSIRVREITPPTITRLKPLQDIFISNDCSPFFTWAVDDAESGVERVEVTLDASSHRYQAEIIDGTAAWQMPVLSSGQHKVTVYVYDNDGNEATDSRILTGFDLIRDRTRSDVQRVYDLNAKWAVTDDVVVWTGTQGELDEWMAGLKGAYNAVDMNRVETAVKYLAGRLEEHGVPLGLIVNTDWKRKDIPFLKPDGDAYQWGRYLGNVKALADNLEEMNIPLYDYYSVFTEPLDPPSPDWKSMDYLKANQIEKVLTELERRIDWMELFDWYRKGNTNTWQAVMDRYPTWGSIEGRPWIELETEPIKEDILRLPWEYKEVVDE